MSDQPSSSSIVAVVGPTATGKTAFAIALAEAAVQTGKWSAVNVISVDSRQVYQGLEICTGVDLPATWQSTTLHHHSGYQHPQLPIRLFGTSLITPNQEWSVAHFRDYALPLIQVSLSANELVLLVGGTGLYHDRLFTTDAEVDVPPDQEIRAKAALLSLAELQGWVQRSAADAWANMNQSDRQNPRRLVRALEKAESPSHNHQPQQFLDLSQLTHHTIGLTDQIEVISQRISVRVVERLQLGAITEVEALMTKYDDLLWSLPAFTSTGCRELRAYIEDKLEYEQLVEVWMRREVQYAKRQLTWWKTHQFATSIDEFKHKTQIWYDLSNQDQESWQTAAIESCILGL